VGLLKKLEFAEGTMLPPELRGEVDSPEKDWPVLGGAAVFRATHLMTGDVRHFGRLFGRLPHDLAWEAHGYFSKNTSEVEAL
jgi:hypothetical protein